MKPSSFLHTTFGARGALPVTRPTLALLAVLAGLSVIGCHKNDDNSSSEQAAVQQSPRQKHRRELPPAAFAACEGKQPGDECSFDYRDKPMHGKCAESVEANRVACRPERHRHKPATPPADSAAAPAPAASSDAG